jgi:hypothetical protein
VETTVNRALFDAQMLTFSWATGPLTEAKRPAARRALAALHQDEAFKDAIQRATGDRSRVFSRLRLSVAALQGTGVQVGPPFDLAR